MSLYADAEALLADFKGCAEETVDRLKAGLLAKMCAPEHRESTSVRLFAPFALADGTSIVLRVLLKRGEKECTMTSVVDPADTLHVFEYSEDEQLCG